MGVEFGLEREIGKQIITLNIMKRIINNNVLIRNIKHAH